jgi:hypothetical protein
VVEEDRRETRETRACRDACVDAVTVTSRNGILVRRDRRVCLWKRLLASKSPLPRAARHAGAWRTHAHTRTHACTDSRDDSQAAGAGVDGKLVLNTTKMSESLMQLLQLDSAEQALFAPGGYDISESGALVRQQQPAAGEVYAADASANGAAESDLETRTLQVLASPTQRNAHVQAIYTLAAAATDGRLRDALPMARRVSIRQLRADDYDVQESKIAQSDPPEIASGLWVVILIGR